MDDEMFDEAMALQTKRQVEIDLLLEDATAEKKTRGV